MKIKLLMISLMFIACSVQAMEIALNECGVFDEKHDLKSVLQCALRSKNHKNCIRISSKNDHDKIFIESRDAAEEIWKTVKNWKRDDYISIVSLISDARRNKVNVCKDHIYTHVQYRFMKLDCSCWNSKHFGWSMPIMENSSLIPWSDCRAVVVTINDSIKDHYSEVYELIKEILDKNVPCVVNIAYDSENRDKVIECVQSQFKQKEENNLFSTDEDILECQTDDFEYDATTEANNSNVFNSQVGSFVIGSSVLVLTFLSYKWLFC